MSTTRPEATHLMLASASPRRADLLRQIGVQFEVSPADIDERVGDGEDALAYVQRMAREKADRVLSDTSDLLVLGADTSVVIDATVLGKPCDLGEALSMLRLLSGRTHEVITAVALRSAQVQLETVTRTRVQMREIDDHEIRAYWDSGEPADKAGSYAIQGLGAVFVSAIQGSYSGVVGLPLCETARLLKQTGISFGLMSSAA